ncbi:MAG: molybdopterin-dependent oxidoreductase, partial [Pseudomonadota bacterium]
MKRLKRPSWWMSESRVTPEPVFWNRRAILAAGGGMAAAGTIGALALSGGGGQDAVAASETLPRSSGLPAPDTPYLPMPSLNPNYADAGRAITDEAANSTYNNFYEFGSHKAIADASKALDTDGWTVTFDGLVEEERTVAMEDLIAAMPVEERIYRHRCVEAWSMVVPWIGFP